MTAVKKTTTAARKAATKKAAPSKTSSLTPLAIDRELAAKKLREYAEKAIAEALAFEPSSKASKGFYTNSKSLNRLYALAMRLDEYFNAMNDVVAAESKGDAAKLRGAKVRVKNGAYYMQFIKTW